MKKQAKQILALILVASLVLALAACGSTDSKKEPAVSSNSTGSSEAASSGNSSGGKTYPKMTLKVGAGTTEESGYVQALYQLNDKLKELTDGAISLEIYPNGQLGEETALIEGVSMGSLDICVTSSSPICNYVEEFSTFDMPFLITDLDHAHQVMDGELGRKLLDRLSGVGIYGLALWDNGFRDLTNSKGPIYAVSDVKGLKIRVMENAIHQALWTDLGAYATPMAWGEVITALQQGTIDGEENPLNAIYSSGVYEVQKYISLTHHVYTAGVIMISQSLWDGFSDDVKAVFNEAIEYSTQWERDYIAKQEEEMADKLTAAGCEINEVNDKSEWIEAVNNIYSDYADQVDQDLLKALQGSN